MYPLERWHPKWTVVGPDSWIENGHQKCCFFPGYQQRKIPKNKSPPRSGATAAKHISIRALMFCFVFFPPHNQHPKGEFGWTQSPPPRCVRMGSFHLHNDDSSHNQKNRSMYLFIIFIIYHHLIFVNFFIIFIIVCVLFLLFWLFIIEFYWIYINYLLCVIIIIIIIVYYVLLYYYLLCVSLFYIYFDFILVLHNMPNPVYFDYLWCQEDYS